MQVKLTKSVITVGSWTLLSRILGMVREILLSTFIGAGPLLDAFVAAFRLPNIFRRFFVQIQMHVQNEDRLVSLSHTSSLSIHAEICILYFQ